MLMLEFIPGGIILANRRRYKELEQLMTRILLADAAVFVLYLLSAGFGWTALKVISTIIAILLSGLSLAFLYLNGEIRKRRSLWLVVGFGAVVVCLLVSLLLNYPAPAKKVPASQGTTTSGVTEGTSPVDGTGIADTTGIGDATGGINASTGSATPAA